MELRRLLSHTVSYTVVQVSVGTALHTWLLVVVHFCSLTVVQVCSGTFVHTCSVLKKEIVSFQCLTQLLDNLRGVNNCGAFLLIDGGTLLLLSGGTLLLLGS